MTPLSWNRTWIEANLVHTKVEVLDENYYTAQKEIIPFERQRFYRRERHASDKMAVFTTASHAKVAVKFLTIISIIDPVINAFSIIFETKNNADCAHLKTVIKSFCSHHLHTL